MSTVAEIENAIQRLSRAELVELRNWFEEFVEDRFELTDEVKAKLDESRREIAAGQFTTRQPQ
jgi:t-SNARE complex subunit (syntaxin)